MNITSIFEWILLSSSMTSVLVILILLVKSVLKDKIGAGWHYSIWFLMILKLTIPYAPTSAFSVFNLIPLFTRSTSLTKDGSLGIIDGLEVMEVSQEKVAFFGETLLGRSIERFGESSIILFHKISDKTNFLNVLAVFWLSGCMILLLRAILYNLQLYRKITKESSYHTGDVYHILDECKKVMGIGEDIPLILTEHVQMPALFGFIKPKILIPTALFGRLSKDDFKYIMLHELSHLKRKDILVNWIIFLLQTLHWFNPILRYGFKRMKQDCEVACDTKALSYIEVDEYKNYGYTIINLLKVFSKPCWIPGLTGLLTDKNHVKRRIHMICRLEQPSWKYKVISICLVVMIAVTGFTNAEMKMGVNEDTLSSREKAAIFSEMKTGIKGKGLIITLNQTPKTEHIQLMIEELVRVRAAAISINDIRIMDPTDVKSDENGLHIKSRYFTAPYTVKAVGHPNTLRSEINEPKGSVIHLYRSGVDFSIESMQDIFIPKEYTIIENLLSLI
ncbi:bla regulator protein BlaR1 [Anaerosolibacter carboniphilus]|uniref:Bla regulator protein BlaR1 n=1 Tax=Anaerosolibacter carboniphilus TaxID=1417629 RepID=A0A841KY83_9FIRM|nr:bla regulator protein BlaR1 [Anaerosolibacter carboniphilus]